MLVSDALRSYIMPDIASRTLFSGGEVLHPNDLGKISVITLTIGSVNIINGRARPSAP
jgi:hypothetical protein